MKILHLIPKLDCNGSTAQLDLLAKRLGGDSQLHICCLGNDGPAAVRLRTRGHRVDCLRWTRTYDPTPLFKLQRLLKANPPDLIHVWALPALRCFALTGRHWLSRTVVTGSLPTRLEQIGRLDRWLLRKVRLVAAMSAWEWNVFKQLGVSERQLTLIPPGVETPNEDLPAATLPCTTTSGRRILGVGPLEPRKGFRDAIWALDILHYVFQDISLALVGGGSHSEYLAWFAACLKNAERVHFAGPSDNVRECMRAADIVWAPAVQGTSRQVALEAMAVGRPVIGVDHPALREIILDGATGLAVAPGDKVALCKRTRTLLLDPALRAQIGAAARRHVQKNFSADEFARRWREEYAAA